MSQIDVMNAKRALTVRLREWGIGDEAHSLASGFIDDLMAQGWTIDANHETRRHPPKIADECRQHPGEWADACRPCATEERAVDAGARVPAPPADATHARAVLTQTRSGLCSHGPNCTECIPEGDE